MKFNKILASFFLLGSLTINAQVNLQSPPTTTDINNGTPFLDASSYYHTAVSGSNDRGKGLVFPQVDLVNFQFNVTQPDGATVLPTWYDGMVVYNSVTGTTLTTGNRSSTALAVTPGFYYFSNPNGETNGNVTGGKWIRMGADAAAAQAWLVGGNTGVTAANAKIGTTDAVPVQMISGNTTVQTFGAATDDAAFKKMVINPQGLSTVSLAKGKTVASTAFPNFVLEVGGKGYFTDGIVTSASTYPDYVFDNYFTGKSEVNPTYKFSTLAETEKFIKENNHLPGVTKIDDLAKGGNGYMIDATQLSVQSLEKIEELYLHTIEQQKQIDELKAQIAELKALIKK